MIDGQGVKEDTDTKDKKKRGIVNRTNDFANETTGTPASPLRLLAKVIPVSIEPNKIARQLESTDVNEMEGGSSFQ